MIHRAWEVLGELEGDGHHEKTRKVVGSRKAANLQISLFGDMPALVEELSRMDVSNMTPLEAINKLYELQQKASK